MIQHVNRQILLPNQLVPTPPTEICAVIEKPKHLPRTIGPDPGSGIIWMLANAVTGVDRVRLRWWTTSKRLHLVFIQSADEAGEVWS